MKGMRMHKSYVWAGIVTIAIAGWLGSGMLTSDRTEPAEDTAKAPAQSLYRVQVREITAQPREASLLVRGRTEASRTVEVRARTTGIVEKVARREGDRVKAGDLLCQIDMTNRQARLAEARAKLASAKMELNAADKLAKQKFTAETTLAAKRAAYDAAQAAVEQMEWEIDYVAIKAPVDGTIAERPADEGSLLQVGGLCAKLLVLDPMLVVGSVSEREVGVLRTGMAGSATLVTGETAEGTLRFVAPSADQATRTFRIELEVPNPDRSLRDGVTSDIRIPLARTMAHKFSPALLGLNDAGQVGVRILDDANRVKFVPVRILGDDKEGVWVDGLPETARLITVGQDYVTENQVVDPVAETVASSEGLTQ